MCGIIGLHGNADVAAGIVDGLIALQHRGQDAAGIASWDGSHHLHKGEGLVQEVMAPAARDLKGRIGIGHVRYPTVGSGGERDAQPFFVEDPFGIAMAHNGNLSNYHDLRMGLIEKERRDVVSSCDTEVILRLFSSALSGEVDRSGFSPEAVFRAAEGIFDVARGAYSAVGFIAGKGLFAFRDPFGIKPLVFGRREGESGPESCIASESVAMDLLEFHSWRDIAPGEVLFVDHDRNVHTRQLARACHHPCIFEHVYFARPDSEIDNISVYKTRLRCGERLAELWQEKDIPVDAVIPVPDSARPAAAAMARRLGVPYREGYVKNRYIGRTFIMPGQDIRQRSIRYKLNPIRIEFEGRDVLIVDDSIVRGNTSRSIIRMARQAGARKVYMASYSPPLRHPCLYGIDMATRGEFIARDHDVGTIRGRIGADLLVYQTLDGLVDSARRGNPGIANFCTACFSGEYPTGDITPDVLASWERDRGGRGCADLSDCSDRGSVPEEVA